MLEDTDRTPLHQEGGLGATALQKLNHMGMGLASVWKENPDLSEVHSVLNYIICKILNSRL